jgi:hypothetical protein
MTTLEQDIASLTQLVNSLGPLVVALTNIAALVWILVQVIRNGRQSAKMAQSIQAHGVDITDIKSQTNSINNALTATNQSLTERLIAANHPEGNSP